MDDKTKRLESTKTSVIVEVHQTSPENGHQHVMSRKAIRSDDTISSSSNSDLSDNKEAQERGQWTGKLDFLISVINYAVGLGNVWRFPYLCYENGGGAFLFPYLVCLGLVAAPSFVMEVSIGQYLSQGGIGVWKLVPIFKGIGYASMTIVALYNIYFIIIVSWISFYIVSSFTSLLPWQRCDGFWNTESCRSIQSHTDNKTVNLTGLSRDTSSVVEFWEASAATNKCPLFLLHQC